MDPQQRARGSCLLRSGHDDIAMFADHPDTRIVVHDLIRFVHVAWRHCPIDQIFWHRIECPLPNVRN